MRKFPPILIDTIVVVMFALPVVGLAAALWTGNAIWLLLIFALCLFV